MNAAPLRARLPLALATVLALSALLLPAGAHAGVPFATSGTAPVTGNISGPSYLGEGSNATYTINATGGPAVVAGTLVGELNFSAVLSGPNLTGVTVSPPNGSITSLGSPASVTIKAGNTSETITLEVRIDSTVGKDTASTNLTFTIRISAPYIVQAVVTAGSTGVLPFKIYVSLDGVRVGNVSVPELVAYQSYQVAFRYATAGLAPGTHTFVLSVANEHGLVTFAGGTSSFTATFYVASPPPNYAVWYVAGTVAFFGALFIFATRVAARRRGAGRR